MKVFPGENGWLSVARNFAVANLFFLLPLLWVGFGWMPDQVKMETRGREEPALVAGGSVLHGEEYGAWIRGTVWRFYLREGMEWDHLVFRLPEGKGAEDVGRVELQKWKLLKRGKSGAGLVRAEGVENGWRFADPKFEWTGIASGKMAAGLAIAALLLLGMSWAFAKRDREESWRAVSGAAALAALTLAVLTQAALPVQSWLANQSAYPFGGGELAAAVAIRVAWAWTPMAAALAALARCFGRWTTGMALAFAACLYLESGVLSSGLPELNGNWSCYLDKTRALWDAGAWAAVFALAALAHPAVKRHYGMVSLGLLVLVAASMLDVKREGKADTSKLMVDDFCTIEEVVRSVEWSPEKNVLVFIVDSLEREQAHAIMEDSKAGPELRKQFRGFTEYTGNMGAWNTSLLSVPNLLTGREPESMTGLPDHYASMYSDQSVLKDYLDAGFAVYLDTGVLGYGFSNRRKGTRNNGDERGVFRRMAADGLGWNLEEIGRFRCWPFAAKRAVALLTGLGLAERESWNDERFVTGVLENAGVSPKEHGVFALFHTRGVHVPVGWDRNGERTARADDSNEGCVEGGIWVMRQLGALFDDLRAKGIYDSSFIVVLADHGSHNHENDGGEGVPGNGRPFLWIKTMGQRHAFMADSSPTWHGKIAEMLRRACLENPSETDVREVLAERQRVYRQLMEASGKLKEWVVGEDGTVVVSENVLSAGDVVEPLPVGERHSLDRRDLTRGAVSMRFDNLRLWPCPVLDVGRQEMGISFRLANPGRTYRVKLELSMKWEAPNEPGSRFLLWQEGNETCGSEVVAAERTEVVLPGIRPDGDGRVTIRGRRGEGLRSNVYFSGMTVETE